MLATTLNNKKRIPSLGLGTWKSDKGKVGLAVEKAVVNFGYRHIDCASIYGNEKEIGGAFKKVFSSKKISRNDLFITSKLWNTKHHPDNVEKACKKTLSDLRLDYLDLYLMHWGIAFASGNNLEPIGSNGMVKTQAVSIRETWQAMEKLVKKGLVKSIGVSNFTTMMLVDLLSYAKIRPTINQIEIHPYNSQQDLVDFCHKQKIQVTAYSPLGSSDINMHRPIDDKTIIEIAAQYKKTPAQILIRWSLQRNLIVIPKSTNLDRVAENINIFDFELSNEDIEKINKLNKNHRFVDPIEWWGIPYFK
jgi:diketogulonate reductase-like aldo/keto reductase